MSRSGLTIIEILIALVIVTVAFMALANLQITNMQVTRDSRQASIATQIANAILENVSKDVYGRAGHSYDAYYVCPSNVGLCSDSGTLPHADADKFPELTDSKFPGLSQYQYSYQLEYLYDTANPSYPEFLNEGLIRATIAVTGPSSLSFTAYLSCYDVSTTPTLELAEPCPFPDSPGGR